MTYERYITSYCCSEAPCEKNSDGSVTCDGGEVLNINTPCHGSSFHSVPGTCYADVSTSKYLDYWKSRYTCEGKEECLTMSNMCQGLCSAEVCRNETLRCEEIEIPSGTKTIERASLKRSAVIEEHSYCKVESLQGNKIFDIVDRSDEVIENTLTVTDTRIDYSYFTNCTVGSRRPVRLPRDHLLPVNQQNGA